LRYRLHRCAMVVCPWSLTFIAMTRRYIGKLESHTLYSHIALLQECHDPPSHITMNTQITKHMCNYQATWKIIIAAIRPYKQMPTLYHGICMSF